MKFIRPFRSEDEFDQKLNQIELWKLAKNPLDVANAIIDRYSRQGWESLRSVPGEAERLKWVGLYPQRQEGDAFMLRLKVPGGGLNAAQTTSAVWPSRGHGSSVKLIGSMCHSTIWQT